MNVAEMLEGIEISIQRAEKIPNGSATIRICQIYKDVMFYLIEKEEISMSDDKEKFVEYLRNFPPSQLYKVANYYRQEKGMVLLDYQQDIYKEKSI